MKTLSKNNMLFCVGCKTMISTTPSSLTDEWLNTEEAARYLKLSKGELLNKVSTGKIPYFKLGRSNRYRKEDLEALLLKNKRGLYEHKV